MRVLVVVLLLWLPLVEAQHVDDPAGDVVVEAGPQTLAAPPGRHGAADLTALTILESPLDLTFIIGVSSMQDTELPLLDTVHHTIVFTINGHEFHLRATRFVDIDGSIGYTGRLDRYANGAYEESRDPPTVSGQDDENTITAVVPRASLAVQRPVLAGDALTDLHVLASTTNAGLVCVSSSCVLGARALDRMPDDDVADAFLLESGVRQEGDARLESDEPYRLSNGGAAAFVYTVTARNLGDAPSTYTLQARDVPDGWSVGLPVERLRLEPGQAQDLPILLTTTSAHQHGGTKSFVLELAGKDGVGRIELGILYSLTPQPAGHHPKLWLHSHNEFDNAIQGLVDTATGHSFAVTPYMNAREDDPADAQVPVSGEGYPVPGYPSEVRWNVPLRPGLAIGLDFDVREEGTLHIPIGYQYLAQDVVLEAELIHIDATGTETLLGQTGPSSPTSFGPDQTHAFELPLALLADADFLPHEQGSGLELRLLATGTFTGVAPLGPGSTITLEPGGWIELPLREYRDPLDAFYAASKLLTFDAPYLERLVNPGKTVLFETSLRSDLGRPADIHLNLTGTNADWARVLGDDTFRLDRGQRKVAVAVTVPDDMPDGAAADLILEASVADDPYRRAVIDLVALVDEEAEHPDQAGQIDGLEKSLRGDKKSPGAGVALLLGVVLGFALRRGR